VTVPVPPVPPATRFASIDRSPIRWGIGDFFWIFGGGFVVSVIAVIATTVVTGWTEPLSDAETILLNGIAGLAQFGGFALLLWALLRSKGRGVLRDLAVFADREWGWVIVCFFGGIGLQIALGLSVYPLTQLNNDRSQELVDQLGDGSGVGVALLAVVAAFLAPIFEELLFRGVLLRALLRRMQAVWAVAVSAIGFGVPHLLDPNAIAVLPALVGFGIVSGVLAVRSGGLLRSIALHMGFNFLTVVIAIGGGG